MTDHFSEYPTLNNDLLHMRHLGRSESETEGEFDPYKLMLKKKDFRNNSPELPTVKWPEEDVNRLNAYCTKMGIFGVNFGNMNPRLVLQMLKKKLGDLQEDPADKPNNNKVLLTEVM